MLIIFKYVYLWLMRRILASWRVSTWWNWEVLTDFQRSRKKRHSRRNPCIHLLWIAGFFFHVTATANMFFLLLVFFSYSARRSITLLILFAAGCFLAELSRRARCCGGFQARLTWLLSHPVVPASRVLLECGTSSWSRIENEASWYFFFLFPVRVICVDEVFLSPSAFAEIFYC